MKFMLVIYFNRDGETVVVHENFVEAAPNVVPSTSRDNNNQGPRPGPEIKVPVQRNAFENKISDFQTKVGFTHK